jgi:hypothetical protein
MPKLPRSGGLGKPVLPSFALSGRIPFLRPNKMATCKGYYAGFYTMTKEDRCVVGIVRLLPWLTLPVLGFLAPLMHVLPIATTSYLTTGSGRSAGVPQGHLLGGGEWFLRDLRKQAARAGSREMGSLHSSLNSTTLPTAPQTLHRPPTTAHRRRCDNDIATK